MSSQFQFGNQKQEKYVTYAEISTEYMKPQKYDSHMLPNFRVTSFISPIWLLFDVNPQHLVPNPIRQEHKTLKENFFLSFFFNFHVVESKTKVMWWISITCIIQYRCVHLLLSFRFRLCFTHCLPFRLVRF